MNINRVTVYIILVAIFFLNVGKTTAHGPIYKTERLDGSKIRITLKWSSEDENKNKNKGIGIAYFYLKNAKTLYIGYEVKDGLPHTASIDFDLNSAIPPIRINLANIGNSEGTLFKDIKDSEAQEYIIHLHDAGIVSGRPDGTFAPETFITRAEFMAIMVKALKLKSFNTDSNVFADIEGHWAQEILLLGREHGLISGYEDNTVRPDNYITLAEVSSVISRAFSFKTSRNGIYGQLRNDRWYSTSVKKMFDVGILTVDDSIYNRFDEEKYINRANCSIMVSRALSTY
jgi:hypothetical protein